MENLNSLSLAELDQEEIVNIGGGSEIGYWLGYYVTEGVKAIGEGLTDWGRYLHESGSPGGAK